jgi:hypothetical protein
MTRLYGNRKWILALVVILGFAALQRTGDAQSVDMQDLKMRIEQRYTVLPLQNGLVLAPKQKSEILSIEVSGNTIGLNGTEVTGGELRSRLGADADLILHLSYLMPAERQTLFGLQATPSTSAPNTTDQVTSNRSDRQGPARRVRRRGAIVRFGTDVTVPRDETVDEDVVVIGGNAKVEGQVNGDVVVVGGSLTLGPDANVSRDVAVVGGSLSRDPGATIGGDLNEVSIGQGARLGSLLRNRGTVWNGMFPLFSVASTALRVTVLVLFGCVVMMLAGGYVTRISQRAAAEPLRAGLTGLLAEVLVLPALIMTIVLLVITIIGIPLLLLLPFAILALVLIFLLGFTAVSARVGQLISTRLGWMTIGPYLNTVIGIVALLLPILLARALGLFGMNFIGLPLLAVGVLIEYVAWTVGFGAAALTFLNHRAS